MSTLQLRALHVPRIEVFAAAARIFSVIAMVMDVSAEMRQQARAAHKRYQFTEW